MAEQFTQSEVTEMSIDTLMKNYRSSLSASHSEYTTPIGRLVVCGNIILLEKEIHGRLEAAEEAIKSHRSLLNTPEKGF